MPIIARYGNRFKQFANLDNLKKSAFAGW